MSWGGRSNSLFKSVKDFRKEQTMQVEGSTDFFTKYVVPGDGNCFFYAYWLATKKDIEEFLSKNSPEMYQEAKSAVEKLRIEIVNNITDNINPETKTLISADMRDILRGRLENELYAKYAKSREKNTTPPQTELEKIKTKTDAMTEDELYQKYLSEARTTLWADERMILTLEMIKGCRIDVYTHKDTSRIQKMEYRKRMDSSEGMPVVSVLYVLNEDHYDALLFDNDAKHQQEQARRENEQEGREEARREEARRDEARREEESERILRRFNDMDTETFGNWLYYKIKEIFPNFSEPRLRKITGMILNLDDIKIDVLNHELQDDLKSWLTGTVEDAQEILREAEWLEDEPKPEQAGNEQARRELETKARRERKAKNALPVAETHVGEKGSLRDAKKTNGRAEKEEQQGGERASSSAINNRVKGEQKDDDRRYHHNRKKGDKIKPDVTIYHVKKSGSGDEMQSTDEATETFRKNLRKNYELSFGPLNDEFLKILADYLIYTGKQQENLFSTFADPANYDACKDIIILAIIFLSSDWLDQEIKRIYGERSQNYKHVNDIEIILTTKEFVDKNGEECDFDTILKEKLYDMTATKWLQIQIQEAQEDLKEQLNAKEAEKKQNKKTKMREKKDLRMNVIKDRKEKKSNFGKPPLHWWKPCQNWWYDVVLYKPKVNNSISSKIYKEAGKNLYNRLERVLAGQPDSCEPCSPNMVDGFNLYNADKVTDLDNHRRNDSIVYNAFLQCFIQIWKASLQKLSFEMAKQVQDLEYTTDAMFDQEFWHDVVWSGWDSWHLCKGLFIQILLVMAQSGLVQYFDDPSEPHHISHRIYFQVYTPALRDAYDHNAANPADLTRLAIWYDGQLVSKRWCHKIRDLFGINQRRFVSAWVDALREYSVIRDDAGWKNKNFFDGVFQWTDVENYVKATNLTPDELKNKRDGQLLTRTDASGKVVKTKNDYCFILPEVCLREFTQINPYSRILSDFCLKFGYPIFGASLTKDQQEQIKRNGKTFNRACQQFTLRMNVAFQELVKTYQHHRVDWDHPDMRLPGVMNGDPEWKSNPDTRDALADEFIRREYMKKFGITEQKDSVGHTRTVTVQASTFATPYLVRVD
jgi:hypothetical protein